MLEQLDKGGDSEVEDTGESTWAGRDGKLRAVPINVDSEDELISSPAGAAVPAVAEPLPAEPDTSELQRIIMTHIIKPSKVRRPPPLPPVLAHVPHIHLPAFGDMA